MAELNIFGVKKIETRNEMTKTSHRTTRWRSITVTDRDGVETEITFHYDDAGVTEEVHTDDGF